MSKPTLKKLLKKKRIIRSLGAHDVLSALVAEQAGFETLFVGGFGSTASLLGKPDLNILTLTEMSGMVKRMAKALSVPLVADGDTGHGGVHNVARTIEEFERANAAGLILEDQISPKRCGHFMGKDVTDPKDMVLKLKAAQTARKNRDFVIIARTDARDVHGIKDAINRVNLYAKAGADVVFIESPASLQELSLIPKKVKAPLLVNMLTGGKTPMVSVKNLEKMGYKIVVYPIESLMVLITGMRKLAKAILTKGDLAGLKKELISFSEIKDIVGLQTYLGKTK